jgi:DNA-binding NtrC family response regulator
MSKVNRKPSILVVEDDPGFGIYLQELLNAEGYTCHLAPNRRHGQHLFEQRGPDLVIVDLVLNMDIQLRPDGIELIQTLRQADAELPIVAMNGCWQAPCHCAESAIKSGASAVLAKPFPLDALFEAVEQLLSDA